MRTGVKVAIAELLRGTGLLAAVDSLSNRDKRLVFTLHRVLCRDEITDLVNPHLAVTEEVFSQFLNFLQRHFVVLPLRDLLQDDRRPSRRRCAITFDDGWEDNYRVRLPLLKQRQMPATVFLATGYLDSMSALPEDRFRRHWKAAQESGHIAAFSELLSEHYVAGPDLSRAHHSFKQLKHTQKLAMLEEADSAWPQGKPQNRSFMTWQEVRTMASAGVTFESHSVNHVLLGVEENDGELRAELATSGRQIREQVGRHPTVFAYPSGSFDRRAMNMVAEAGYSHAFTTQPGALTRSSQPLALPRIAIDDTVLVDSQRKFRPARAQFHIMRHLRATAAGPLG